MGIGMGIEGRVKRRERGRIEKRRGGEMVRMQQSKSESKSKSKAEKDDEDNEGLIYVLSLFHSPRL